jgi:uncharacterized protein
MNLTEQQLEEIEKFAKRCLLKNDSWHRIPHTQQTVKLAMALAKKENADIEKCVVSAWLHDIAKYQEKENKNHGDEGAKIAWPFLEGIGFFMQDINDICYAIQKHNKSGYKKTIESKIIWDADKLQAVGPYGLLRIYGIYVAEGKDQEEAYRLSLREQKFYIKNFYTLTAKKIAQEKFKSMKPFHANYEDILKARF